MPTLCERCIALAEQFVHVLHHAVYMDGWAILCFNCLPLATPIQRKSFGWHMGQPVLAASVTVRRIITRQATASL